MKLYTVLPNVYTYLCICVHMDACMPVRENRDKAMMKAEQLLL